MHQILKRCIVLRVIQGLSSAGSVVISRAVATDLYRGREMTRFFGLLMTIILSMLFLVACGGDPDKKEGASAGTAKDTLVIAQGADAKSLDPHASNDNPSSNIRVQIYDRLMES